MKDVKGSKNNSIKIVLIGNSGVGKTCISQKFINENKEIDLKSNSTMGQLFSKIFGNRWKNFDIRYMGYCWPRKISFYGKNVL